MKISSPLFFILERKGKKISMEFDYKPFELNDAEIQSLEEAVQEASKEIVWQDFQVDNQQLFQQAMVFINNLKIIEVMEQKLLSSNNQTAIKNIRLQQQQLAQKKYLLALNFDMYLTKFRGEVEKKLLYVYSTKTTVETYELPLTKLALLINTRLRINVSRKQLLTMGAEKMEDKIGDQEHIVKVTAAYRGVQARLEQYFARVKGQKQSGILLWKTGPQWTAARVLNYGDLKEAYAAALMSKHGSVEDFLYNIDNSSNSIFAGHELIQQFFENYIAKVTNLAALKEEDVVTSEGQWAVKSKNASLPSIEQYRSVAEFIIEKGSLITLEELQQSINDTFKTSSVRNVILNKTNIAAMEGTEEIEKILKDLKRDFNIGINL